MRVLLTFIFITVFIYVYLIFYLKVDIKNILDIMHSAFIRQLIFEIIPFFVLYNVRDMSFINIASAPEFFNSVIGRTIMGMVGFTFVSYVITAVAPKKIELNNIPSDKKEVESEKEILHGTEEEKPDISNEIVEENVKNEGVSINQNYSENLFESFGNIKKTVKYEKYRVTNKNSRLFEKLIDKVYG